MIFPVEKNGNETDEELHNSVPTCKEQGGHKDLRNKATLTYRSTFITGITSVAIFSRNTLEQSHQFLG